MEVLQYNTDRTQLIIPEYGRHVQIMVNQLIVTQDREERNQMSKAIIGIMGNMNPHLRDVPDFQHKLSLFIIQCSPLAAVQRKSRTKHAIHAE